jgi:hypothetical protein
MIVQVLVSLLALLALALIVWTLAKAWRAMKSSSTDLRHERRIDRTADTNRAKPELDDAAAVGG